MSLTDTQLLNISRKYAGKPELEERNGLSARISPKSIITFNYRFRWLGKQQRIKIGCYLTASSAKTKKNGREI